MSQHRAAFSGCGLPGVPPSEMFAPKFDPNKLKTNLRICSVRLKNLYQKKNELNVRARRELAEYLKAKKIDRARIRVEQIVREDYLLEVLEIIELYCELLVTRLGLITSTVECDPGLKEAIATIIWVAPRLSYDCQELEVLKTQFAIKYGREFAQVCSTNANHSVNPKVMHKLNVKAPPANLCEAYLVEIARSYEVEFTPDMNLLNNAQLIDLGDAPELPSYQLMSQDMLQPSNIAAAGGGGVPYPTDESKANLNAALPSLPPDSGLKLLVMSVEGLLLPLEMEQCFGRERKVSVVGAGAVGTAAAFAIMTKVSGLPETCP
ncbi:IST1 -like protein [Echinococcus granulosus]|nr:IST1 -like protein [Echinococcus granulosus]